MGRGRRSSITWGGLASLVEAASSRSPERPGARLPPGRAVFSLSLGGPLGLSLAIVGLFLANTGLSFTTRGSFVSLLSLEGMGLRFPSFAAGLAGGVA